MCTMGLFSLLKTKDINVGVRNFLSTKGVVLLDAPARTKNMLNGNRRQ